MNLKIAFVLALSKASSASLSPIEFGANATFVVPNSEISSRPIQLSQASVTTASSTAEHNLANDCNANESLFVIDLNTDGSSNENRWVLKKWRNVIVRGPRRYNPNSHYTKSMCLSAGTYKLVMFDKGGDGLSNGNGSYSGFVDGMKVFSSPSNNQHWKKRAHKFTITNAPPAPTPNPSPKPNDGCTSSEQNVKVEILTDKWGLDTSWEIANAQGVILEGGNNYGSYENDSRTLCLAKGSSYNFVLRDQVGDGMCCSQGQGYYKVSLFDIGSWREIISGGAFRAKELNYVINLKEPKMNARDVEWLDSHNSRRKKWHTSHGKSYVPLRWSESLKADAKVWAEKLLDSCGKGMWHDPDNYQYGENVAGNSGSGSWGTLRSTEDVLTRFVEREENKPWPQNSHLTQVLWRGSHYVGCAEASSPFGDNGMCHTQVCRYSRSGNCNMGKYKSNNKSDWWLEPVLLDDSPCGFECPPDGCS